MAFPANFTTANAFTQKWEKGYCNHPNDPGGATYNGVSLRFLKDRQIDINGDKKIDINDILTLYRNKDQAKVDEIFYEAFWLEPGLDRINSLLIQTCLYDANVNTGRTQAVKFLQRACNAISAPGLRKLEVDGKIGPLTLSRVADLCSLDGGRKLARAYLDQRLAFHNMLVANSPYPDGRNYRPFAAGWRNRVNDLRKYLAAIGEGA